MTTGALIDVVRAHVNCVLALRRCFQPVARGAVLARVMPELQRAKRVLDPEDAADAEIVADIVLAMADERCPERKAS